MDEKEQQNSEGRTRRGRKLAATGAVVLLVAAVSVFSWAAGSSRHAPPTASTSQDPQLTGRAIVHAGDRPVRVLFAGDSLTFGSFASTRDRTYRALVMKGLRHHVEATNDAVGGSGQTSKRVVRYIHRPESYDLVVVETGTNDATKEPPDQLRGNYAALLSAVRRESAGSGLVCLGSWLGPKSQARVDEVIRSECASAGGVFVPLADLYRISTNRGPAGRVTPFGTSDDFHPNDAGHAAIADRVLRAVRLDKTG